MPMMTLLLIRPTHPHQARRRRRLAAAALAALLTSCGGGGDAGAPLTPTPVQTAWWGYGRDAQHSALGGVATQALARLLWNTAVDQAPQYTTNGALLIHYGSPVITAGNTVVMPVKTGATDGFRFDARAGTTGTLLWSARPSAAPDAQFIPLDRQPVAPRMAGCADAGRLAALS